VDLQLNSCADHRNIAVALRLRRVFFGAAVVVGSNVAAIADDQAPIATVPSAGAPQTLTSDWFGTGRDPRNAGFDTRVEWSQFFQGMPGGSGAGAQTLVG
jgi:hypothetical protein